MPTNWSTEVTKARADLATEDRVVKPCMALDIIDDVVNALPPSEIAMKHGIKPDWVETVVGHVTTAIQGGGPVKRLCDGGWYESSGHDQPYHVAPGFAAVWRKAPSSV